MSVLEAYGYNPDVRFDLNVGTDQQFAGTITASTQQGNAQPRTDNEYTLQNSKFCIKHEPENINLQNKISKINEKLKNNLPTIPTTLKDEIECNIFLRANNIESFSKLRDLKDNF